MNTHHRHTKRRRTAKKPSVCRRVKSLSIPKGLSSTHPDNYELMHKFVATVDQGSRPFWLTAKGCRSKYMPHQGEQEKERRRKRMAA